MRAVLLGFCVGISLILSPFAVQFQISSWITWLSLLLVAIGTVVLSLRPTQLQFQQSLTLKIIFISLLGLSSAFFGFGYAQLHIKPALQQQLKEPVERTAIVRVIGISDGVSEHWRQVVEEIPVQPEQRAKNRWLLYSAFDWQHQQKQPAPDMQPGQFWQVNVKLKPPRGYASVGIFDSEKWLLQQHIQATGTLAFSHQLSALEIQKLQLGNVSLSFLDYGFLDQIQQLRFNIRQHFLQFDSPARGVLLGLLTGDRSLIDADITRLYQQMGISHLLAISGPHVLLAALVISWLWQACLNRWPKLYLIMERPRWVLPVFLIVVIAYALLAGFDIPAQRTVLMVLIIASLQWWRQSWRIDTILLLAASVLLWLDPLAILSAAFWLSFGAVAMLLLLSRQSASSLDVAANTKPLSFWKNAQQKSMQFVVLQWRIFVLLSPLVIWCFAKLSWLSPVVNLIAIPLLGMLIVPLNLLALGLFYISSNLADGLWQLALNLLELFHAGLLHLSGIFPKALQPFYLTTGQLVALWACLIVLLLPKGILPRWWLAFLLIPVFYPKTQDVPLKMQVLDVGQGLSVLLTTPHHAMLVDTGAKTSGFDVGEQVVLPALYAQGVKRLDKLMLTHLDNDHSGGAEAILNNMPVIQLTASAAFQQFSTYPCAAGQRWVWDDVVFNVLSPLSIEQAKISANENSCILMVETPAQHDVPAQRVLIMGDAGFYSEFLLQQQHADLQADVLVLGHHGSVHSSSSPFLQAVHPQRAVVSAGYHNRYGHPTPVTLSRLQEQAIFVDSTILGGTLTYSLGKNKVIEPQAYRQQKIWLQH